MEKGFYLNLAAVQEYIDGEGGGRYELYARGSDGLIVIRFINKHGSVFDVLPADEFSVGDSHDKQS